MSGEFGGGEFSGEFTEFNEDEEVLDQEKEDGGGGVVSQILDMSLDREIPEGEEQGGAREALSPDLDDPPEIQENKSPESLQNEVSEILENKVQEGQEEIRQEEMLELDENRMLSDLSKEECDLFLKESVQEAAGLIRDNYDEYLTEPIEQILSRNQILLRDAEQMDGNAGSYTPGTIEIDKTITVGEALEVIVHELLHASAFQPEEIASKEDGSYTVNTGSGLLRTVEHHGTDGTVQIDQIGSRGLDEGMTEFMNLELLSQRDVNLGLTAARTSAYPGTSEFCGEAARLVGLDPIASAYFSGNVERLQQCFDALAGDYGFLCFYDALDRTLDTSPNVREMAAQECLSILNHMTKVSMAARKEEG